MPAFLRRWQIQWLRNVIKNSTKARSDLGEFSGVVPDPPPEIFEARLGDAAFNDLREREKGNRFISFVAVPDQAFEANARCLLRHLLRQAGFTHSRPAGQHDYRSMAS